VTKQFAEIFDGLDVLIFSKAFSKAPKSDRSSEYVTRIPKTNGASVLCVRNGMKWCDRRCFYLAFPHFWHFHFSRQ
jgi:coproporphyrinogen III oxidase-like Fe-S oxidoreductase